MTTQSPFDDGRSGRAGDGTTITGVRITESHTRRGTGLTSPLPTCPQTTSLYIFCLSEAVGYERNQGHKRRYGLDSPCKIPPSFSLLSCYLGKSLACRWQLGI